MKIKEWSDQTKAGHTPKIKVYPPTTGGEYITFANAGQTVFTVDFPLSDYISVYVNGVFQPTGYSWSFEEKVVTFTAPFLGGEEIVIL